MLDGQVIGWGEVRVSDFNLAAEQVEELYEDVDYTVYQGGQGTSPSGLAPPPIKTFRGVPLVTNLCVDHNYRGMGVGESLLNCCLASAASWDDFCYLKVEKTNAKAINFYKGVGWSMVYEDGASRRVDVGVFGWKEVRTVEVCMRKRCGQDVDIASVIAI